MIGTIDDPVTASPFDSTVGHHPRRADIQGLRAVAVLLVVVFHAGLPVDGGFIGVDVFFVISGFVITALLMRELNGTGQLSFADFYARRVRRILPALALTTIVVAIGSLGAISQFTRAATGRTGIAASLFASNIYLFQLPDGYFDPAPTLNPLLHMWSLSVEEQFYLVFPALLLGGFLLGRRVRPNSRIVVGAVIAAVALASFALCLYTTDAGPNPVTFNSRFAFYMAPTRAWEFSVGALLSLAAFRLARIPRPVATVLGITGAALVVLAAVTINGATAFPGTAALVPVGGTALLLVAGTATTGGVSALLSIRPMTRIGDVSYSWYLWHWPVIVFAAALWPDNGAVKLIAAAGSIVPAALSYRWLELPIHGNPRWSGRRALALATVCIAAPIVAGFALLRAPVPAANAATRSFLQASRAHHADQVRGCNRGGRIEQQPETCTWTTSNSKGRIVLLGDSNAGQFAEPLARAADRLGYDLTVATMPSCPFVDLELRGGQANPATCREFVTTATDELVANPPALVVLAASTTLYLHAGNDLSFRDPATNVVAATSAEKATAWTAGLRRQVERFGRAGTPTLVVHTIPQWLTWDPRGCAAVRVYYAPRSCGASQSRTAVADARGAALSAERRAIRPIPTASAVDFLEQLCDPKNCTTNRDDFWLYRDGRHLSVRGALALTDDFVVAVSSALHQ